MFQYHIAELAKKMHEDRFQDIAAAKFLQDEFVFKISTHTSETEHQILDDACMLLFHRIAVKRHQITFLRRDSPSFSEVHEWEREPAVRRARRNGNLNYMEKEGKWDRLYQERLMVQYRDQDPYSATQQRIGRERIAVPATFHEVSLKDRQA
jgi:hypothetical protein